MTSSKVIKITLYFNNMGEADYTVAECSCPTKDFIGELKIVTNTFAYGYFEVQTQKEICSLTDSVLEKWNTLISHEIQAVDRYRKKLKSIHDSVIKLRDMTLIMNGTNSDILH